LKEQKGMALYQEQKSKGRKTWKRREKMDFVYETLLRIRDFPPSIPCQGIGCGCFQTF
jgi:hypothetical protein